MEKINLLNLMTFQDFIDLLKEKGIETSKSTVKYAAENGYIDYVLINPEKKNTIGNMLLLKNEKTLAWQPKKNYDHNKSNYRNIKLLPTIENFKQIVLKNGSVIDLERNNLKAAQSESKLYFVLLDGEVRTKNIYAKHIDKIILTNGELYQELTTSTN